MPRAASNTRRQERSVEWVFSDSPEGTNPAHTLPLDFWHPELWENKFLVLFSYPVYVICHRSPRKVICSLIPVWLPMGWSLPPGALV